MFEAQSNAMIWTGCFGVAVTGIFLKQVDIVVAAAGLLIAGGVWRFGQAYRDRLNREIASLSRRSGGHLDDTIVVKQTITKLQRAAERAAGRMIFTGTVISAVTPVVWRLLDITP
ncbi:hypothetical protein QCD71_13920 [Sphingomonas sp. PsM26]|nr:hypothetical protein [Sphingomonas sp. PsM26]